MFQFFSHFLIHPYSNIGFFVCQELFVIFLLYFLNYWIFYCLKVFQFKQLEHFWRDILLYPNNLKGTTPIPLFGKRLPDARPTLSCLLNTKHHPGNDIPIVYAGVCNTVYIHKITGILRLARWMPASISSILFIRPLTGITVGGFRADSYSVAENNTSPGSQMTSGACSVGICLFSRAASSQVSSTQVGLTAVFGMGTGVPPPPSTPTMGTPLTRCSVWVSFRRLAPPVGLEPTTFRLTAERSTKRKQKLRKVTRQKSATTM